MNRIELAARKLCSEDGCEPDDEVVYLVGDDLTAEEIDDLPARKFGMVEETSGPHWRLYRPRAAHALNLMDKAVRSSENVTHLRKPIAKEGKVG